MKTNKSSKIKNYVKYINWTKGLGFKNTFQIKRQNSNLREIKLTNYFETLNCLIKSKILKINLYLIMKLDKG